MAADSDDGFVTVNLDDEYEECDICHQTTNEAIIHVTLDDLFTIYEGSYDKHYGRVTKTHQVCLDRWSDIIRRNLKWNGGGRIQPYRDEDGDVRTTNSNTIIKNFMNIVEEPSIHTEKDYKLINHRSSTRDTWSENNFQKISKNSDDKSSFKVARRKNSQELNESTDKQILSWINELQSMINDTSKILVEQLQLRDRYIQELSGQKSLIAQLIKRQKDPTLKQWTNKPPNN